MNLLSGPQSLLEKLTQIVYLDRVLKIAGVAGFGAAEAWVAALKGTLRFEMPTTSADRPAADAAGSSSRYCVTGSQRCLRSTCSAFTCVP